MTPYHHLPGYLHRWVLAKVGRIMVRTHHILTPDNTPFLHTHPFHFCSIILSGGYTEQIERDGELRTVKRRKFSVAFRSDATFHRIVDVEPNTRTLFFTWSTVRNGEQGWSLKRHHDVPVPPSYNDPVDGIYQHGTGYRLRQDGVWYALRPTPGQAFTCGRISLHQHIPQEQLNALRPPREHL